MSYTGNIVNLTVTQTDAPTPSTLQQTGAFVSYGGTTLTAGTSSLLTSSASLATLLKPGAPLTSLTWTSGLVTATASSAHGLTIGSTYQVTIAGAVPAAYNGVYLATVTTTTAFTYSVASNPGTETTPGTWSSASNTELVAMNNTWWAQGNNASVLVLELGTAPTTTAPTLLDTYITNNLYTIYGFIVPRWFDGNAAFLTMAAKYTAPTAMLYFFVTTTNATFSSYTALLKCIVWMIEAPAVVKATELSVAAEAWNMISPVPSNTYKLGQMQYKYVFGVTPYPVAGNGALFAAWSAAGGNWIGTGYQGGISTAIIMGGTTADSKQIIGYWYSVDWVQINIQLNMSNAIINGAQNGPAPLQLNQLGINTLQTVAAQTMSDGVTFGLVFGTVQQTELDATPYQQAIDAGTYNGIAVINAVPFVPYYQANEGQYTQGIYNGYSISFTPQRGFSSITVNINVTGFVA